MREICTSGSVGGPVGQPAGSTRFWKTVGEPRATVGPSTAKPSDFKRHPGRGTISEIRQVRLRQGEPRTRRLIPPAGREPVKEPTYRDQLGTKGSAGGKLPARRAHPGALSRGLRLRHAAGQVGGVVCAGRRRARSHSQKDLPAPGVSHRKQGFP